MYYTFLLVLLVINSLVLIAAVLLQSGKGSGLSANFGGSSSSSDSFVGTRQAATLLTRITWWGGGMFLAARLHSADHGLARERARRRCSIRFRVKAPRRQRGGAGAVQRSVRGTADAAHAGTEAGARGTTDQDSAEIVVVTPSSTRAGFLLLEDGTLFRGLRRDAELERVAEVVFTTNMTGYQEVFTDPSYGDQIVVMTTPMIGNYGVNADDPESAKPQVAGVVVRELTNHPSNWRASGDLRELVARRASADSRRS